MNILPAIETGNQWSKWTSAFRELYSDAAHREIFSKIYIKLYKLCIFMLFLDD